MNIGLLGELAVEAQIVRYGWHPIRLDTAQMASNADLMAVDKTRRLMLQIKTTDGRSSNSHSDCLGFGNAGNYGKNGTPIFNSKKSPLIADVVVGVHYLQDKNRFVVLPVGLAEKICQFHCNYWFKVPKKNNEKRSPSFQIYLAFLKSPKTHSEHHNRIIRNLRDYENAWHVLDIDPEKLRDPNEWQIND